MQRAAAARAPLPPPPVERVASPAGGRRARRFCNRWPLAAAVVLIAAGLFLGLRAHWRAESDRRWTNSPAWRLMSARLWWEHAREHGEIGDFRLVLGTVKYALALDPDDDVLLRFQGDMHESLRPARWNWTLPGPSGPT